MVEEVKTPTPYAQRLAHAMTLPGNGMNAVELANDLGITRQAIKKLFNGGSNEMSASNNARAALRLNVDPTWLAIGEGVARPSDLQLRYQERTLIKQFRQLPADDQEEIALMLEARLELYARHKGEGSEDPFSGVQLPPRPTGKGKK